MTLSGLGYFSKFCRASSVSSITNLSIPCKKCTKHLVKLNLGADTYQLVVDKNVN